MKSKFIALLGGAALSLGIVSAASAADMAVKARPMAPPPVLFTWTGFYIGGFVGGAFGESSSSVSDPCLVGVACGLVGTYNGVPPSVFDLSSSVIGGGTIGYNWQAGQFVLGLEAEGGYMRLRGSRIMNPLGTGDTVASTVIGDGYAVFAGRLGWAVDRTLFYVKGGGVWTRNTNGVVDVTGVSINSTTSHDVWGWAVGAGLEYALTNNWSIKGEYLYLGIDKSFTDVGIVNPGGAVDLVTSHNPGVHTAKLGVNYRF